MWRTGGEDGVGQCDVPLQHPRVRPHLVLCWGAKVHGPRYVRGAFRHLSARVEQVDLVKCDALGGAIVGGLVMNHLWRSRT